MPRLMSLGEQIIINSRDNDAQSALQNGDFEEAERLSRQNLAVLEKTVHENHEGLIRVRQILREIPFARGQELALHYFEKDQFDKALVEYRSCLDVADKEWKPFNHRSLDIRDFIAECMFELKQYSQAVDFCNETLKHRNRSTPNLQLAQTNHVLALSLSKVRPNGLKTAERLHQDNLWLRKSLLGEQHYDTLQSQHWLARVKFKLGAYAEAADLDRKTLRAKLVNDNFVETADVKDSRDYLAEDLEKLPQLSQRKQADNQVKPPVLKLRGNEDLNKSPISGLASNVATVGPSKITPENLRLNAQNSSPLPVRSSDLTLGHIQQLNGAMEETKRSPQAGVQPQVLRTPPNQPKALPPNANKKSPNRSGSSSPKANAGTSPSASNRTRGGSGKCPISPAMVRSQADCAMVLDPEARNQLVVPQNPQHTRARSESAPRNPAASPTPRQPATSKSDDEGEASRREAPTSRREPEPPSEVWFRRLRNVHALIDERPNNKHRKVRIAILDTGIDGTHPEFCRKSGVDRIMGYRSWVDPVADISEAGGLSASQMRKSCKDVDGHGTHATALLLQVDPLAEIYVARLAKSGCPRANVVAEVC